MPQLDYGTAFTTGFIILAFVSVLVLLATTGSGRGRLIPWTLGNLAFLSSRLLFAFQPRLSPWLGVLLANALAYAALAAYCSVAVLLLSGRLSRILLAAIGGLTFAALVVFTWPMPFLLGRIEAMCAATFVVCALTSVTILRLGATSRLRIYSTILSALFAVYGVFFALRGAWFIAAAPALPTASFLPRDFSLAAETAFSFTWLVGINFVLLLTLMTRLEREITAKVLEIGQSRNELQVLYNVFLETAGTLGLEELVPNILDLLVRDIHARTAALHLVDRDSGELSLLAQRGYDSEAVAILLHPPKGASVAAISFERQESVIWTLGDYPDEKVRGIMARQGVVVAGGFPISARGVVLGSMTIGFGSVESLDPAREAFIGSLALQLGIVIRAARLHEELDRANARLDVLASTDALTGLANRRTALRELARESARAARAGGRLAVVMGDLDHFKDFNDRWGHDCGDYVLANTAAIIAETVRASDHAARWGGEEFLVILGDADPEGVLVLAERLRRAVSEARWEFGGHRLAVTISLGAAVCDPARGGELAVAAADEALYEAKAAGRDRVVLKTFEAGRGPAGDRGTGRGGAASGEGRQGEGVGATDEVSDLLPVDDAGGGAV